MNLSVLGWLDTLSTTWLTKYFLLPDLNLQFFLLPKCLSNDFSIKDWDLGTVGPFQSGISSVSNCDENQKLKLWWNSKTQIVMKLKNLNCDETKKLKLWQKLKNSILTKFKLWQNSNCDKIQMREKKSKKNQILTKFKLWKNLKTQIMTKLKNLNGDKTQ